VGVSTFIDDTEEKAIKRAKKYFEEYIKMFGPLRFVRGQARAWVVGPPERVTERLMELPEQYPGLEEVNVGTSVMSTEHSAILEQLDLFGKEVMPKFNSQTRYQTPIGCL